MTKEYYREFAALKALSISNVKKRFGRVSEVTLYLSSSTSGEHTLVLAWPRLPSRFTGGWSEFKDKVRVEESDVVKVFAQAVEYGKPDKGLSWRVEICRDGGQILLIVCKEIRGLPA